MKCWRTAMSFWNIFKKKDEQNTKKHTNPSIPKIEISTSNTSSNEGNDSEELNIDDNLLEELVYKWESGEEIIDALLVEANNQTEGNVKFIEYLINLIESEKIEIPMLPDIVMKIISLSQDSNTELRKYVELVKSDQAIALKVIKLANSTMYRGIRDVNDLNLAISRIGVNELKNLVLMLSLQSKVFKNKEFRDFIDEIWKASLLTSILSSKLAKYYSLDQSKAYTIALIHDVGELVVFNSVKGYQQFYKNKYVTDNYFIKRIAKSFHQEISAFTLAHWNFSKEQIDIVRNHHLPPNENSDEYKKLLFIAYQTAIILLNFKFTKDNIYNFPYEFLIKFSKLPLSEDAFYLLLNDALKEFNELSLIIS
jgi:HD-like signal output (HDOD) protein